MEPALEPAEQLVRSLAAALRAWVNRSEEHRQLVYEVGRLVLSMAEPAGVKAVVAPPSQAVQADATVPTAEASPPVPLVLPKLETPSPPTIQGPTVPIAELVRQLNAGALVRGGPMAPTLQSTHADAAPTDLSRLERRCRVKADAYDFAIRRQQHLASGGTIYDFKTEYEDLRERAKPLAPCDLWMIRDWDAGYPDELLLLARRWYLNLAAALALARDTGQEPGAEVMERVAECQSGLRVALQEVNMEDRDVQLPVFMWLREQTSTRRVYLPRFLSMDSPADPADWAGALERVEAIRKREHARAQHVAARRKALNELRYNQRRLIDSPEHDPVHYWKKIGAAVEAFCEAGGRLDAPELLSLLEPLLNTEPPGEGVSPALARAIEAVEEPPQAEPPSREETPEVAVARQALRGTTVVMVGGVEKQQRRAAIEQAFELAELKWIATDEHTSLTRFEADVARPETALVIMMVRWSSHSYEGLKRISEKYGKKYLRLPRGYNPAQIAHEFVRQSGRPNGA